MPVIKFWAPGPEVTIVAAKPLLALEYASAIIAAACSCATQVYLIFLFLENASTTKEIAPPVIKKTLSPSGKIGYFYFRLGQDPALESQKLQGYLAQKPELKHFRFNVRQQNSKRA